MPDLDKLIEELRHVIGGLTHVQESCRFCKRSRDLAKLRQRKFRSKQKEKFSDL